MENSEKGDNNICTIKNGRLRMTMMMESLVYVYIISCLFAG